MWNFFHHHICIWSEGVRHIRVHTGIILWMRPANERQCYSVTLSLIGWVHIQNDSWHMVSTCFNSLRPHTAHWAKAWDCQNHAVLISWRCWWYHAGYKWHFRTLVLLPKLVVLPKYLWFCDIWVLFVKIWTWMASTNIDTQTLIKNTLT